MGEIKVSPDYNWFRSTVPLKKVCSAVLSLHATSLLVLCSSRLALDNAEQLWQCLSSQTVSPRVLGVHESTLLLFTCFWHFRSSLQLLPCSWFCSLIWAALWAAGWYWQKRQEQHYFFQQADCIWATIKGLCPQS